MVTNRNSLGSLDRTMREIAEAINEAREEIVAYAGVSVIEYVADNTPVLTGRAVSNWIVTLDKDTRRQNVTVTPRVAGRNANFLSKEDVRAKGVDVALRYRSNINKSIRITNNTPYIVALDQGSSQKAPEGFSDQAVLEASNDIEARVVSVVNRKIDAIVIRT